MDVGDLLELERTFHGNGVVHATTQEQGVLVLGKVLGPAHHLRLQRQHGLQGHRQVAHGSQVFLLLRFSQLALGLRQGQRQQEQARQLRGEGLGRGHTNFHACAGDVAQLALAHHGTGGYVADGQGVVHAQALGMAQGCQCVGCLAGLADGDHQRLGIGHTGAVAVFAGHFHIAGDTCNRLQPVLGSAAAVVAGAASQDQNTVDVLEHAPGSGTICAIKQLRSHIDHAFQRVPNSSGLLKDFLLHVVAVGAKLHGTAVCMHGLDGALLGQHGMAVAACNPVAAGLQIHQITLFQIHDLVGDAGHGHGVRGQEEFAVVTADAQHQRRACTATDHAVRFILVHHSNGVGTMQLGARCLDGFKQIAVIEAVYQVANHLRVGLAGKDIALGFELRTQGFVVFNDAVVHQRHTGWLAAVNGLAGAIAEVGVGIAHGRLAMGGPAGVGNTGQALQVFGRDLFQQLGHTSRAACTLQALADGAACHHAMHGHATGVIAAVFQSLQTLHQQGNDVARRHCADDATHRQNSEKVETVLMLKASP